MIYTKSESKHLNLKRIHLKIPIKLIPINLKWLIAMIGYNKLALRLKRQINKGGLQEDIKVIKNIFYIFFSKIAQKGEVISITQRLSQGFIIVEWFYKPDE